MFLFFFSFPEENRQMALSVGTKFDSFDELNRVIKQYEEDNCANLYKKESRTIEAAAKKCPKKTFNSNLKYAEVIYACVRNGKYKSKVTTGERPNQSTIRSGCQFSIKLRSYDGQFLEVRSHGPAHNHECKKECFMHYPSQRRLDKQDIEKVSTCSILRKTQHTPIHTLNTSRVLKEAITLLITLLRNSLLYSNVTQE